MPKTIEMTVDGSKIELDVDPGRSLVKVLREDLGLNNPKEGCGSGECGACTVLVDNRPVRSCLMLAVDANGCEVTTIAGLTRTERGKTIAEKFVEAGAVQCGFCTPAMVLVAGALLEQNPSPSEDEIRIAISGNLCRCTGYAKIVEAIRSCG